MRLLQRLNVRLHGSAPDPQLVLSQIRAMTRQGPLLYLMVAVNIALLCFTHQGLAPRYLTLYIPAGVILICILRGISCLRADIAGFTEESAKARFRLTVVMTGVLGMTTVAWAVNLLPYGDAYTRTHVAFFISLNTVGSIFCLMYLRTAAILLGLIVVGPFLLYFAAPGQPVLAAISVNFTIVLVVMLFILSGYNRDFTALVHSQRDLVALSTVDFLTGLPNRRSFFRELERLIAAAQDSTSKLVVGIIDLDGFKPVNDLYGHAAGDQVLVEIGRRLGEMLGQGVTTARLGGDEFGIVFSAARETSILETGEAICAAVRLPVPFSQGTAQVAASVGFAIADRHSTPGLLVEQADYALYHAKAKLRGRAIIFSARHEKAIRVRSLLEQELRRIDFASEMMIQFQPIVDVAAGEIVAYEALARWASPKFGPVAPADFITAAERIGLINGLTEVLFAKAMAAMASWPASTELTFNLSARDVASQELMMRLSDVIASSGIAPRRICFEITETALMHDFAQARQTLLQLKAFGVKIALDDFGAGYSSMSSVHRLPLDIVKIDRSFVAELTQSSASRNIVKSMIDLCANLGIGCIVEGVETVAQKTILRDLGCVTMQGYLFGRPGAGNRPARGPRLRLQGAGAAVGLTGALAEPS